MTKQDLIQEIEKACRKANPGLESVATPGCRLLLSFPGSKSITSEESDFFIGESLGIKLLESPKYIGEIYGYYLPKDTYLKKLGVHSDYVLKEFYPENIIKILGKEPQLADVLLALGVDKQQHEEAIHELLGGYIHSWDMLKGLYGQSLETLQFIHSLLS